ncbi:telomerase RNA component interacting RNase isoform X1 [Xenopus laevis]|uniref:Telomerase RNA component interacting RNase isoform X1 n=1 Tax=Xenopus laevis TaxID=8355 RepID=A0A8J0U553_XENLA|nr:telomerase RNA component interacting RNase isoform X1 [Xenopus laevis]
MAEAQREVTEGNSEAEAVEVPARHKETIKMAAPRVTGKGEGLVSAAHTGPSPTPSPRPSPALTSGVNLFANDGSFMELFKKQMEAKAGESSSSKAGSAGEEQKEAEKSAEPDKRRPISIVRTRGIMRTSLEGHREAARARITVAVFCPFHPQVGKRRGGAKLALKTGIVTKKPKNEEDDVASNKGGAWAQYMAEVKKYKAHQCSDDDKTRPLVK